MSDATSTRIRREPPAFRRVVVVRTDQRTPHLVRVTLGGPELAGLDIGLPAASVRLLVPSPGRAWLILPTWTGNEFRFDDGTRPPIRTVTPLRLDPEALELDVEVVLHGDGPLSSWAEAAGPGDEAAVSGTARGYEVDPGCRSFVLAGDESALPAISMLLEALPREAAVQVLVEVAESDARLELPDHPGASVTWLERSASATAGEALVTAVARVELAAEARVWVAGEAAAVQRIRKHLFDERGLDRTRATVRGYWKHGRAGAD